MIEKKVEVKTFITKLYCDECGEELKFLGYRLCTYPYKYPYECPKCGKRENSFTKPGEITYEEIPVP